MREMKDSGIEWIGEIPNSWTVRRGKTLFVNTKYIPGKLSSNYDRLSLTLKGVLPRKKDDSDGLQPKDFDTYQLLRENELVFKLIDLQNVLTSRVGLAHATGLVSPAYIVLHANEEILPAFAEKFYLMMWYREIFNSLGDNGVRSSLNISDLLNIPVCYPKMEEQIFLTNYLDTKCSEIDATAEDIRKEISLLEDYKKSVITEAVTKGLNPDAEMKDSGIGWIGDIPKDWEIIRIKNIGEYRNGLTYKPTDITDENTGILVLRSSNIQAGKISLKDNVYVSTFVRNDLKVQKGDILICSRNGSRELVGKNAIIEDLQDVTFGAFMMIFRCDSPKYLYYILNSKVFSYYLGSFFTSTINQLTGSNFGNMKIVYVSNKLEQNKIVSYLDSKCSEIDAIIADKKRQRGILAEYKKSLIYEYVTGKKEVPINE